MPTPTFTPLATTTTVGTVSTIDIANIPALYNYMQLKISGPLATSKTFSIRFNGDTGSNYSWGRMGATTSTTFSSTAATSLIEIGSVGTDGQIIADLLGVGSVAYQFPTVNAKNSWMQNNQVMQYGGYWRSEAVVNQITIIPSGGSVGAGLTVSLYGIVG